MKKIGMKRRRDIVDLNKFNASGRTVSPERLKKITATAHRKAHSTAKPLPINASDILLSSLSRLLQRDRPEFKHPTFPPQNTFPALLYLL